MDAEIVAISQISSALQAIEDPVARRRVLSYVLARFSDGTIGPPLLSATLAKTSAASLAVSPAVIEMNAAGAKEIAGVARLTDDGQLRITIRDLKAKNGLDAATRLALVAIYAHQELVGQPMSSRRGLTPILREWRLYDGNTRARLARNRGILRDGDNLTLDAHAKLEAQHHIEDILNPEVQGTWRPR